MQRFDSEHDNGSQTLLRLARNNFYTTILLIWERASRKRLVLVTSEVLGQLVNTLTADYKHSAQNRENLPQRVQTMISQERKTFSGFFIAFLKCALNSVYFEKKDQSHSLSITEINNSEIGSYLNVFKAIFHATVRQSTC